MFELCSKDFRKEANRLTTQRITIEDRIRTLEGQVGSVTRTLQEVQLDVAALRAAMDVNPERLEPLSQQGLSSRNSELSPLPESLQTTLGALSSRGKKGMTADDVSKLTSRSRCLESTYLNRLTSNGYLTRRRIGLKVIYKPSQSIGKAAKGK
jgi:uncharacterized coiled-coil protein SlyX